MQNFSDCSGVNETIQSIFIPSARRLLRIYIHYPIKEATLLPVNAEGMVDGNTKHFTCVCVRACVRTSFLNVIWLMKKNWALTLVMIVGLFGVVFTMS